MPKNEFFKTVRQNTIRMVRLNLIINWLGWTQRKIVQQFVHLYATLSVFLRTKMTCLPFFISNKDRIYSQSSVRPNCFQPSSRIILVYQSFCCSVKQRTVVIFIGLHDSLTDQRKNPWMGCQGSVDEISRRQKARSTKDQ